MKLYRWDPKASSGNGAYDSVASKKGSKRLVLAPRSWEVQARLRRFIDVARLKAYTGVYEYVGLTVSTPGSSSSRSRHDDSVAG